MKYRHFNIPWRVGVTTVSDGRSTAYIGIDYEKTYYGPSNVSPVLVSNLLWSMKGDKIYYEV